MYLQFHSAKDPSKNHDIRVHVLFCSYGLGFSWGSCTFIIIKFWFGSVLDKTWVLFWFILAGFGFFPISTFSGGGVVAWRFGVAVTRWS